MHSAWPMSWQLWACISALAAGVTAVFAKAGLEHVPSHLGNAVRTAIVLVLSLGLLWVTGEHHQHGTLTRRAWVLLALSGVATAVSWIAYFKALSAGQATPVSAIDKASLVVTMVLAVIFLGERLTWRLALGVSLIVTGSILASSAAKGP
jgi:transporter family protein